LAAVADKAAQVALQYFHRSLQLAVALVVERVAVVQVDQAAAVVIDLTLVLRLVLQELLVKVIAAVTEIQPTKLNSLAVVVVAVLLVLVLHQEALAVVQVAVRQVLIQRGQVLRLRVQAVLMQVAAAAVAVVLQAELVVLVQGVAVAVLVRVVV
jgi:hypothetical protein